MLQILIQGMLLSGLYALIAVGFTLIFSVGRVLNLAYGSYLLIGGYVYFYFTQILEVPKVVGIFARRYCRLYDRLTKISSAGEAAEG